VRENLLLRERLPIQPVCIAGCVGRVSGAQRVHRAGADLNRLIPRVLLSHAQQGEGSGDKQKIAGSGKEHRHVDAQGHAKHYSQHGREHARSSVNAPGIPVTNSGSARPAITANTGEEGCAFRLRPSPNVCLKSLRYVFFTRDSLRVQPRDRSSRSVITRY
jgi:hypothetical protein